MSTNMSLNRRLSSNEAGMGANQRRADRNTTADLPMSEKWVNVGLWETVDGEPIFINLGGFPFDRLKEINGNSALSKAKRRLQQDAAAMFDDLAPGDEDDVVELVVRFRRNAPNEDVRSNDDDAPRLSLARQRPIAAE
jgi:hypothetical protein